MQTRSAYVTPAFSDDSGYIPGKLLNNDERVLLRHDIRVLQATHWGGRIPDTHCSE